MINHPNRDQRKPLYIDFIRDGHSDSVRVKRGGQDAGHIYWRSAERCWQPIGHGAALQPAGSVHAVAGPMKAFAHTGKGIASWEGLGTFATLREAMQAMIDADPRAEKRDCARQAASLLQRFRQYTGKDAA